MANLSSFITAILSVTLVLGIMIFVHEWGHFMAAKLAGVRVEVFSFGFGPRLFGVKRGDTDYRLSALPFGGYVRMSGDNPIEERTGADYEFLSKPRWVRVLIACAGPAMNLLLAFLIFWGIFWIVGMPADDYLRTPPLVAAVSQGPVGAAVASASSGVLAGDQIVAVNGVKTPTWEKVYTEVQNVPPGNPVTITVQRGGSEQTIQGQMPAPPATLESLFGFPSLPPFVGEVGIGTAADRVGLRDGDKIVSMDGTLIVTWGQLVDRIRHSDGKPIHFVILRAGETIPMDITPVQAMGGDGNTIWQVGVLPKVKTDYERQSFLPAARFAGLQTALGIKQIGTVLGGLFTGKVKIRELQSVVGIARESGRAAKRGPLDLMIFMAVISLNLGLLNLLPIPILDGGHVLLLTIEGILRRDLSIAVKERFVQVGLVFLLGISAFVIYSDIFKLVQSH